MATTIKLKNSVTTTNAPSSLVQGEVAINITDKKVWVGNAATTPIQLLGAGASGTFGALTCTSLTNSGLTSGRVTYASTGGLLADSANFTFNGTTVTMANDASISGLTVGKGGGAGTSNTALGVSALPVNSSGGGLTAIGFRAGYSNTTGDAGTYIGRYAGNSNTTGGYNTTVGDTSLYTNTTGSNNTAIGYSSLYSNTTANNNTAVGYRAIYTNTTGTRNTAIGGGSLFSNTTGNDNTCIGESSMVFNTTGASNSALGQGALYANTTGANNVAIGYLALFANTTASFNTAVGYQAGYSVTTGAQSVFVGYQAGNVTTGTENCFVGSSAGLNNTTGNYNTYVGRGISTAAGYLMTTGSKNTILGGYSGNQGGLDIRTASNYIVLSDGDGNPRSYYDGANNEWICRTGSTERTRITSAGFFKASNSGGYTNIAGAYHELYSTTDSRTAYINNINATLTTDGVLLIAADRNTTNNTFYALTYYNGGAGAYKFRVADSGNVTNTNGSYGTISDIKNKENIVDATPKLDKLKQLQVRNFNFKGDDLKQIGFVAQEFEQVFPSMVEEHHDKDADGNDLGTTTKSIKTSVLVPILVKAVQELTAKVEALEAQLNK